MLHEQRLQDTMSRAAESDRDLFPLEISEPFDLRVGDQAEGYLIYKIALKTLAKEPGAKL